MGKRDPGRKCRASRRDEDAAKNNFFADCVAHIYRCGWGREKDPAEGAKWLGRAAELGHARATLDLGEAHWKGDGVKADPVATYASCEVTECSGARSLARCAI
jgi:TPR repeat protein